MSRQVFIHIGDAHVCSAHPRNADRLAALDEIIAAAKATPNLSGILWPGDLYHQKSTVDDRNALLPRVQALADRAPVVICYGNHDEPGDLDVFARLHANWPIYVIDRPHVLHFKAPGRLKVACFVLPYPHKAGLVAAGVAHDQLGGEARALLDAAFIDGAAQLRAAADQGALSIAVMHVNIGGALSSTGQPQIGREIELDPALLARLDGAAYIGANHIHRQQTIHGATYAGSVCRMDFGENEEKGFVEVHAARDGGPWSADPRFIPLDVAEQHTFDGRLTRDAFVIETIDGQPFDEADWMDRDFRGDIRVRYRFAKAEITALDVAKIHAEFAGCRSLKLDGQPDLEHSVRAPEVVAAVTLADKVAAFCALNRIAVTDRVRDTLQLLEAHAGDGAAVVKAVQQVIDAAGRPAPPVPVLQEAV